jgi:hypothetical protein
MLASLAAAHKICALPPPTSVSTPTTNSSAASFWSKEAIFTLIGIPIALVGIVVTVLLTSSKIREWARYSFKGKFLASE